MKKTALVVLAISVVGLWSGSAGADPAGDWKRPNGEIAQFYKCEGKLCCKIVEGASPGFEMCHGMTQTGPDEWQGQGMKHPEMPGFMTFNGTVKLGGPTLDIKGCALGQAFCASETWTKLK
jgi:uncharacterized protein (DUF2147 family)